ncbi:hypothetical protein RHMOL_Rhmol10G0179700 [Rhododendron molle]|nr:hypothetical protein RHMOL_Rhmol10G0179700 [Rhododendron molle]KAI8535510.1 hypothetical protein RHMOL_Rhmol10G0179700 [Rhododendron molle]KAI8535511.1 hypothetical protein RHMOL_Rhmol10G0179700 [Rhododendron molle]
MDIVGPELSEPANTISSFKLAGLLESAIRSSNAQYDDRDILDRLRVKMMAHNTGDRGWDVFPFDYEATVPLNTVFTESVMGRLQLLMTSRKCQVLWDDMNHFATNLQYYIMFEVLEVSWSKFLNEMEVAKDLDDLLAAHEIYLHSIIEKSLLGERSRTLYKTLFVLFDLILRFRSHADRLYEGIHEFQAKTTDSSRDKSKSRLHPNDKTSKPGSWVSEGRKALTQRAIAFLRNIEQDLDAIGKEYSSLLEGFISQLPVQKDINLKFLLFRLDFTEFYSRMHPKT